VPVGPLQAWAHSSFAIRRRYETLVSHSRFSESLQLARLIILIINIDKDAEYLGMLDIALVPKGA
jgi:hypothetical protein